MVGKGRLDPKVGEYTEQLCAFAEQLRYEDLPIHIVEQTKKFIADYYAASFAGYIVNKKFNSVMLDIIKEYGGTGQASILFEENKYPVINAAFMNAVYAHGADMDDGNRISAGHIGAHVMSAVFAMAEKLDVTWKDVFVALNVGYEFFNRIAGAAQPSLYNKGFHSTGIGGAIACGASCAKLMGLDVEGIYNSVSLSAIQSSGLIIIDESGQGCKPINPANATKVGIVSASAAAKGVISSTCPLESTKGWFQAFSNSVNESILLGGLGQKFTIGESYLKLYPSCRHTHSCIDAVLEIRADLIQSGRFGRADIEKIYVYIYPSAIKSAGHLRHPKTSEEAKFSIQYAISTAWYKGTFALCDLNVKSLPEKIGILADKTELISDASLENREIGVRGARVQVVMTDGYRIEKEVMIPKGEGSSSLDWDDLKEKMRACTSGLINTKDADGIVDQCKNLQIADKYYPLTASINELMRTEE